MSADHVPQGLGMQNVLGWASPAGAGRTAHCGPHAPRRKAGLQRPAAPRHSCAMDRSFRLLLAVGAGFALLALDHHLFGGAGVSALSGALVGALGRLF
ncbi:MAG: hypothetical protein AAF677_18145 [Pseudomonadota bacterium]